MRPNGRFVAAACRAMSARGELSSGANMRVLAGRAPGTAHREDLAVRGVEVAAVGGAVAAGPPVGCPVPWAGRRAPLPAHNYVGEYQGLAALPGRGFAAIFTMAAPQAKNGPTDFFFARIGPG
jgi:hypothetical protein